MAEVTKDELIDALWDMCLVFAPVRKRSLTDDETLVAQRAYALLRKVAQPMGQETFEDWNLPVRIRNAFRRAGIKTVADLTSRTETDLRSLKNFGTYCIGVIKIKLIERDLKLRSDPNG